jgi:hypothetical protein
VAALAVANLMLAAIIWFDHGSLPGLGASGNLAPGKHANVITDDLRIRTGPGFNAGELTFVGTGDEVLITGAASTADNEKWWPVEITQNGQIVDGYVWQGGIEVERSGVSGAIDSRIEHIKQAPGNLLDRIGI